jgi:hypothetical protein
VLASLIAPAVQSARRAARKTQCLSNMRQVGLAMQNFASSNAGSLPALVSYPTVTNSAGVQGTMGMPWPMLIMPALDNSALLKNIRSNAVSAGTTPNTMSINTTEQVSVEVFACPDDVNSYKTNGGLSWVVNAGHMFGVGLTGPDTAGHWGKADSSTAWHYPGIISWDGNSTAGESTDEVVGLATGVFWRQGYSSSLDYVGTGDGTTTTLMLTENLQAGTWYSTTSNELGFGIRIPTTSSQPSAGLYTGTAPTLKMDISGTGFGTTGSNPDQWFINRNLAAAVGTAARPSSQHAGGVNVIMCDGAGKFLNENMDKIAFAKLVTSNGVTYGEQTLNEASY